MIVYDFCLIALSISWTPMHTPRTSSQAASPFEEVDSTPALCITNIQRLPLFLQDTHSQQETQEEQEEPQAVNEHGVPMAFIDPITLEGLQT